MPEVVITGHTGHMVPPATAQAIAAAIAAPYQDPVKCREMGANSRPLIEQRFMIENNVGELIDHLGQFHRSHAAQATAAGCGCGGH